MEPSIRDSSEHHPQPPLYTSLLFPFGISQVKNPLANAGDTGDVDLISGSGRSPGEGNGNPLQYSCLENPMDRRAWWATVHGVTEIQTRLSTLVLFNPACSLSFLSHESSLAE